MGLYKRKDSSRWWMTWSADGQQFSESTGTADVDEAAAILTQRIGLHAKTGLRYRLRWTRMSGVYALRSPKLNLLKIGCAKDLEARIRRVQTDSPEQLQVVMLLPVIEYHGLEEWMHQRFESKRVRGEWFDIDWLDISLALTDYFAQGGSHV